MKHPKRLAAALALCAAVAAGTAGLARQGHADDILTTLGVDRYATQIAGSGIALWPAVSTPPVNPQNAAAYAQSLCGGNFPGGVLGAAWVHVHLTGFGWGPPGSQDRDAFVLGIDPAVPEGPAGQEHVPLPQSMHPDDSHHDAWLLWFVGIPDPGGHPCWGWGGGA